MLRYICALDERRLTMSASRPSSLIAHSTPNSQPPLSASSLFPPPPLPLLPPQSLSPSLSHSQPTTSYRLSLPRPLFASLSVCRSLPTTSLTPARPPSAILLNLSPFSSSSLPLLTGLRAAVGAWVQPSGANPKSKMKNRRNALLKDAAKQQRIGAKSCGFTGLNL